MEVNKLSSNSRTRSRKKGRIRSPTRCIRVALWDFRYTGRNRKSRRGSDSRPPAGRIKASMECSITRPEQCLGRVLVYGALGVARLTQLTQDLSELGDYPGLELKKVSNELGDFLTLDGVNVEISFGSLGQKFLIFGSVPKGAT